MKDKYLLIISILLGVLAVIMVNRTISGYAAKAKIPTTTLYQAIVDVPAGEYTVGQAIDRGFFRAVRDMPTKFANSYQLAIRGYEVEQFATLRVGRRVPAWEFLQQHHLRASSSTEIRREVPQGKRLLAIQTSEIASTGYFVQPGEKVDVYRIRTAAGLDEKGQERKEAIVVARNVEVFSVDSRWMSSDGVSNTARGVPYSIVTVAVPEELLEQLMVAREEGMLTLIPAVSPGAVDTKDD